MVVLVYACGMIRWITGSLDSPSHDADTFWPAVTRLTLSPRQGGRGEYATLHSPYGDAFLEMRLVDDGPARAHLDLHVEDVAAQTRRVVGLGAAVVRQDGETVVLRSPGGLPFGLVRWHGESLWPEAERGRYRMCLDVPSAQFDVEGRFWSSALVREWPTPLNVLLRRAGDAPAGMHLHLRCADPAAEVQRHVELGASIVRAAAGKTTFRDPAGQRYCLTDLSDGVG
jgi:hypothetical protein